MLEVTETPFLLKDFENIKIMIKLPNNTIVESQFDQFLINNFKPVWDEDGLTFTPKRNFRKKLKKND